MFCFALLLLTGFILYIVPHGRVAYWADWRLWGLSKTQWTDIHLNVSLLFILSGFLHIYYNWKQIVSYLKNRAKKIKIFTKDFNIALLITVIFVAGTYFMIPPFSWVLNLSESIKDAASVKYGEPPYGHAELSTVKTFAKKMGFDAEDAIQKVKKRGLKIEGPEQTLKDIANANGLSPQGLYLMMKPEKEESLTGTGSLPDSPPPGIGRRPLADLCSEFGLNTKDVLRGLSKRKIDASAEMTIKEIAEKRGMSPVDVYGIIKELSGKSS